MSEDEKAEFVKAYNKTNTIQLVTITAALLGVFFLLFSIFEIFTTNGFWYRLALVLISVFLIGFLIYGWMRSRKFSNLYCPKCHTDLMIFRTVHVFEVFGPGYEEPKEAIDLHTDCPNCGENCLALFKLKNIFPNDGP